MQYEPRRLAGTGCPRTNSGQHLIEQGWCVMCGVDVREPITITVYGDPQPAGSKRAFALRKGGVLTGSVAVSDANPKAKCWKQQVAYAAREAYSGELLDGPLRVSLRFFRPRPKGHYGANGLNKKGRESVSPTTKPDVLKLARGVEDALTSVVYRDDAQIVSELLTKEYGEPARCEIVIETL